MAQKNPNGSGYKCLFCNYVDNNPSIVSDHQQTHDPVFVPMTKEELTKLIMYIRLTFMSTDNSGLISEDLFNRLNNSAKYRNRSYID
jgi:hypothetical protein